MYIFPEAKSKNKLRRNGRMAETCLTHPKKHATFDLNTLIQLFPEYIHWEELTGERGWMPAVMPPKSPCISLEVQAPYLKGWLTNHHFLKGFIIIQKVHQRWQRLPGYEKPKQKGVANRMTAHVSPLKIRHG